MINELKYRISNIEFKKIAILNFPYLFIILFMTKIWQSYRYAQGTVFAEKLGNIIDGINLAFRNFMPSLYPSDVICGITTALIFKYIVYLKGKNAKKFRKGVEYGSARWGDKKDIDPFVDYEFDNNVILTKSERLMMGSRPKDPKNARNKNVLIIGGSGSGKTRFWLKPNLMQMHSSYVVTDPNGI